MKAEDQIYLSNQQPHEGSVSFQAHKKHWFKMSSSGVGHVLHHLKAFISRADRHWLAPSKSGLYSNAFHAKLCLGLQWGEKSQPWHSLLQINHPAAISSSNTAKVGVLVPAHLPKPS